MIDMTDLDKIALREVEIAKAIEALQKEADELAVARKVIARINLHKVVLAMPKKPGAGSLGPPRPEGTPTTFEMTEIVLEAAEKAGKDGVTGKELVDGIREKFWPGLRSGQVLPTIYGFVNNKRLHKTAGGKFKRLSKV